MARWAVSRCSLISWCSWSKRPPRNACHLHNKRNPRYGALKGAYCTAFRAVQYPTTRRNSYACSIIRSILATVNRNIRRSNYRRSLPTGPLDGA
jgi:hypothetical protein